MNYFLRNKLYEKPLICLPKKCLHRKKQNHVWAGGKLMQTAMNLPSYPYPPKNLIKNDPFLLKLRTLRGSFLLPKDPFRIHFTKEHNNIYN